MILWLSSYPRSGNTLLRTILHQTMGIGSYDSELLHPGEKTAFAREYIGALFPSAETSWEKLYKEASESPETYVIKTHHPPCDGQPAIYIVRDGRLACWSYKHFHESFAHMPDVSLLDIIVGYGPYGNWTTHYRAWNQQGTQPTLLLRYENLVNPTEDTLRQIAAFIKHSGDVKPWVNPFPVLKDLRSDLFREGKSQWMRPEGWSDLADDVFRLLHGPLMQELGYMNADEAAAPLAAIKEPLRQEMSSLLAKASADSLAISGLKLKLKEAKAKLTKARESEQKFRQKLKDREEGRNNEPSWWSRLLGN